MNLNAHSSSVCTCVRACVRLSTCERKKNHSHASRDDDRDARSCGFIIRHIYWISRIIMIIEIHPHGIYVRLAFSWSAVSPFFLLVLVLLNNNCKIGTKRDARLKVFPTPRFSYKISNVIITCNSSSAVIYDSRVATITV